MLASSPLSTNATGLATPSASPLPTSSRAHARRPSRLRSLTQLRHAESVAPKRSPRRFLHLHLSTSDAAPGAAVQSPASGSPRSTGFDLEEIPEQRDPHFLSAHPSNRPAELIAQESRRRSTSAPAPLRPEANNDIGVSDMQTIGMNALSTTGPEIFSRPTDKPSKPPPHIRFLPHNEASRGRPSLDFMPMSRTLPAESSIIRVGRYSERDNHAELNPSRPSDAPLGFKSKVVSRRHCEFFYDHNQWYIRDVKSSSGTFLNHIRLSQPNAESKPFPIKDGDVVQLGIDFKGGEEMIFRCVKIKIECNRDMQRHLNKFNKQNFRQIQRLAGKPDKDGDAASKHSTECTICLNSVSPCQALFVAPCSHTWHYKCIRSLLVTKQYPYFTCPNCRARHDLEADIEEPDDAEWDPTVDSEQPGDETPQQLPLEPVQSNGSINDLSSDPGSPGNEDLVYAIHGQTEFRDGRGRSATAVTQYPNFSTITVAAPMSESIAVPPRRSPPRRLSPNDDGPGPLTPRNTAGPYVFDGAATPSLDGVPEHSVPSVNGVNGHL